MNQPLVSIIICTRDRASDLAATLTALGRTHIPDDLPTELVVVDNASADDTARVVGACRLPNMPVRYVLASRRGKGHAYNAGLAAGLGQVFLFTDDDVRPPHDWVAGMCRPILAGEADAVAGGVRLPPHLEKPWMTVSHKARLACTDWITPGEPHTMVGANMAFSRCVLEEVPAFDTELGPGALGFYDESLFTWQLKEAGYRVTTALDVAVEHWLDPSRTGLSHHVMTARKYGQSLAYIAHHWEHRTIKATRLRQMRYRLRLMVLRLATVWQQRRDFLPETELICLQNVAYFQQYRVERRRPRNYEKNGLVKLTHE